MTFRVQIDLGSPAMDTGPDVARALREIAEEVEKYEGSLQRAAEVIIDGSGRRVGQWKITRTN